MPPGPGAEDGETTDPFVVGQQAEGVTSVGMANHVQRHAIVRHRCHRSGQILPCPIQIGHAKPLERRRCRLPDAAIVQRHDLKTPHRRKVRKTPVERLRHRRGACHHNAPAQRGRGMKARRTYRITIAGLEQQRPGRRCLIARGHVHRGRTHCTAPLLSFKRCLSTLPTGLRGSASTKTTALTHL